MIAMAAVGTLAIAAGAATIALTASDETANTSGDNTHGSSSSNNNNNNNRSSSSSSSSSHANIALYTLAGASIAAGALAIGAAAMDERIIDESGHHTIQPRTQPQESHAPVAATSNTLSNNTSGSNNSQTPVNVNHPVENENGDGTTDEDQMLSFSSSISFNRVSRPTRESSEDIRLSIDAAVQRLRNRDDRHRIQAES